MKARSSIISLSLFISILSPLAHAADQTSSDDFTCYRSVISDGKLVATTDNVGKLRYVTTTFASGGNQYTKTDVVLPGEEAPVDLGKHALMINFSANGQIAYLLIDNSKEPALTCKK